jgi:pimeloyl-ACP methyl ester carboxylesterase
MGGRVAMNLAGSYSDRVKSVIIVDSHPMPMSKVKGYSKGSVGTIIDMKYNLGHLHMLKKEEVQLVLDETLDRKTKEIVK